MLTIVTSDERRSRLTRVALQSDGIEGREDILNLGTEELRGGSKRVPVLPEDTLIVVDAGLFLFMVGAGSEGAAVQKVVDCPGHFNLTGVGPAFIVDKRIK
jgi:hypothetical protein